MTTIANCLNLDEALGLKALLDSAGIPSFIPDENAASIAPHHFMTQAGVRLQVAEEQAEEARQLIGRQQGAEG